MRFSYNRLWKLLIDKGINNQELKRICGVSSTSMAKLGKGRNVITDVILRIYTALGCEVGDIMELIPDKSIQQSDAFDQTIMSKGMQS